MGKNREFDIGGGTPTKLSVENLRKITEMVIGSFDIQADVVFSIETTSIIAAKEPEKLLEVYRMGYKRISMGIQTISERLLNELGREGTTRIYEQATLNVRKTGFKQLNFDIMYGFLHQSSDDFENTIRYAISLNTEYITLYRNRYKGTKLEKEAEGVSLYKIICQYRLAYKILVKNGYAANVGKNTFSKVSKQRDGETEGRGCCFQGKKQRPCPLLCQAGWPKRERDALAAYRERTVLFRHWMKILYQLKEGIYGNMLK